MKISIITICKNCKYDLERTIKSVISQNATEYEKEYIIIDGNSTDGTIDIINTYNEYIDYWISESDKGIYDAMNKGVRMASGDYVVFMNAGDWFENHSLDKVINLIDIGNPDILYGRVSLVIDGKKWGTIGISKSQEIGNIFYRNVFCHQGMIIKKALFDEIGQFDIKYKVLADYDWNLKAYHKNVKIVFYDSDFSCFSYGGTCTNVSKAEEYREIVTKYRTFDDINIKKEYEEYKLWDLYKAGLKRRIFVKNEKKCIDKMPNTLDSYIVWGAGGNGEEIFQCFYMMGVNIPFFLDKDSQKNEFHGIKVVRPKREVIRNYLALHDNCGICITPKEYESEIKEFLQELDVSLYKIITFREIENWIADIIEDSINAT